MNKKYSDEELKKILEIDDAALTRFRKIREEAIAEAALRKDKGGPLSILGISGSARSEFDNAAQNSNSEFLLGEALKEAAETGLKTEMLALREYDIKPCKCCYSTANAHCHFYCSCYPRGTAAGDDMSNIIYDKILDADAIIFATPVNNFKLSSHMALFLDRCISLDGSLQPADPTATKNKELNIKHTRFIEMMADRNIPGSGFYRRFTNKTAGIIVTGHEEGASMVISQLFMTLNHFGMVFPPYSNMYAMASILEGTYKDQPFVTNAAFAADARALAKNVIMMAKVMREKRLDWRYDPAAN